MSKRQLTLPLPRPRASRPLKRARRDFSEAEFVRALVRNGFQQSLGGLHFIDTRDADAKWIEGVCRPDHIRLARRATLAKILRSRGGVSGNKNGHRVESREGQESNRQNRDQLNG